MPSVFPGAIDSFTDPLSTSPLNSPSHAGQHQDLNDAVEKLEQYTGLVKVIPTGATNGTVGATGTVTVGNAVSSVTVSGAFSSLYDNYRIIYTGGTCGSTIRLSLYLAGITTNVYYGGYFGTNFSSSAFVSQNDNGASQWNYTGVGTTAYTMLDVSLFSPFATRSKFISAHGLFFSSSFGMYAGECASSSSATGFVIVPSASTLTGGSIRIYGYRN